MKQQFISELIYAYTFIGTDHKLHYAEMQFCEKREFGQWLFAMYLN